MCDPDAVSSLYVSPHVCMVSSAVFAQDQLFEDHLVLWSHGQLKCPLFKQMSGILGFHDFSTYLLSPCCDSSLLSSMISLNSFLSVVYISTFFLDSGLCKV